jgi:hypothetical protein
MKKSNKKPWHLQNPERLEEVRLSLREKYPNLHLYPKGDVVLIKGSFPVAHEGKIIDRFQVEIILLPDYPHSAPLVCEVGGRIPQTLDRHVYEEFGVSCILLPDERMDVCPPGTSLVEFLDGPVRNYFLGQSLVELGQPWPFGEYSHGTLGRIEYYQEILETEDASVILRYLECLAKMQIKGHWFCPCGSGKKLRTCHIEKLFSLRKKIPPKVAKEAFIAISNYVKDKSLPRTKFGKN